MCVPVESDVAFDPSWIGRLEEAILERVPGRVRDRPEVFDATRASARVASDALIERSPPWWVLCDRITRIAASWIHCRLVATHPDLGNWDEAYDIFAKVVDEAVGDKPDQVSPEVTQRLTGVISSIIGKRGRREGDR